MKDDAFFAIQVIVSKENWYMRIARVLLSHDKDASRDYPDNTPPTNTIAYRHSPEKNKNLYKKFWESHVTTPTHLLVHDLAYSWYIITQKNVSHDRLEKTYNTK